MTNTPNLGNTLEILRELYNAADVVVTHAAIHIPLDERYSGGFNSLAAVLDKVDDFLIHLSEGLK